MVYRVSVYNITIIVFETGRFIVLSVKTFKDAMEATRLFQSFLRRYPNRVTDALQSREKSTERSNKRRLAEMEAGQEDDPEEESDDDAFENFGMDDDDDEEDEPPQRGAGKRTKLSNKEMLKIQTEVEADCADPNDAEWLTSEFERRARVLLRTKEAKRATLDAKRAERERKNKAKEKSADAMEFTETELMDMMETALEDGDDDEEDTNW